jgi:hypothetical protein
MAHLNRWCEEAEEMMNVALEAVLDDPQNGAHLMRRAQNILDEVEKRAMEPDFPHGEREQFLNWREDTEHEVIRQAHAMGWQLRLPMSHGQGRKMQVDNHGEEDSDDDDEDSLGDDFDDEDDVDAGDWNDRNTNWKRPNNNQSRTNERQSQQRSSSTPKMPKWNPISGPGDDPLPPFRSRITEPITIVDTEEMPIHQFYLTDFNSDPANVARIKEATSKARQRREQIGGNLLGVFKAAQQSNKPKLIHLEDNPSARGEIFLTDFNRHDLLEVCKTVNWRAAMIGSRISNWRLLGVGTGLSEGRLYLVRAAAGDEGLADGLEELLHEEKSGRWEPVDINKLEEKHRRIGEVGDVRNKFERMSVAEGKKPVIVADRNSAVPESSVNSGKSRASDLADPMANMTEEQARNYIELVAAQEAGRKKNPK